MSVIVRVDSLCKEFSNGFKAVDSLSFTVNAGEVYGFLGQNGAGKSTTIRMLLTLITPSSGQLELFGMNLAAHRKEILRRVGAIVERPDVYKYLTALENLEIFAQMSGMRPKHKELMAQLEMVGLAERAASKVKTYSQGMKQRLGIAIALIHDPELIILDEPTNGLDPQGIADVRKLVWHLSRDRHKTLLVSSHLLSEMELIADSMLIIDRGRKIVEGKTRELLSRSQVEIQTDDRQKAVDFLIQSNWKAPVSSGNGAILLDIDTADVPQLTRQLVEAGINIYSLRRKHSLEDYFLEMTKNHHGTLAAN
jgi:ABC-type multidrug transport system ATPase subunit